MKLKLSEPILALVKYKNIKFYRLDLSDFSKHTIAENWVTSGKLFNTSFLMNNVSNFLRLLLLWKYSGTYFDLDVISQVSLESIRVKNFVCAETKKSDIPNVINNAIFHLESSDVAHKFTENLLTEFMNNYKGNIWGKNGPFLVTKVARNMCEFPEKTIEKSFNCSDITVLSQPNCYEIGYENEDYNKLFSEDIEIIRNTLERLKTSYFVHYFHHATKGNPLKADSNAAFIAIAKEFCPTVLNHSTIDF
ncbi:CLUMA_CG017712, isoform A [Clunio marinus]|uniref:CLUMA_CG017712, isoform A n=1 Tax=Clunio marinus TaxID=568069 RepID=A0A1J1IX14_9DIPT|nr:CLUMA_CG017712, isoform A [Clunio marinus]